MKHEKRLMRWRILGLSAAIGLGVILTACGAASTSTPAPNVAPAQPTISASPTALPPAQPTATAAPTETVVTPTASVSELPSCTSPAALTPAQTEGPYYTPNTPERASLIEPGMSGTKLIVTGYVFATGCQPIANAWLDFWQTDDEGEYDNAGYVMRGHQFTDANGRYQLETVLPGLYPGRTRHIHVKVQAPNGPILTSQIYFPGEPANTGDGIFDPALIADVQTTADGLSGTFNFVINAK